MSDCLVSRGVRVRFLPPAPIDFSPEPELKGYRWTGSSWFSASGRSLGDNTLGWARFRRHGPGRRQADASHAFAPPSPGRPRPLSSVEERRASNPYAGVRLAQRAPTACLARRTQAALLKRPDQVRLLGGAPSASRSFSSQDACMPCRRRGCESFPRPQERMNGRAAYGGGLLDRRGHQRPPLVRIQLHPPEQRVPDRQSRVIGVNAGRRPGGRVFEPRLGSSVILGDTMPGHLRRCSSTGRAHAF